MKDEELTILQAQAVRLSKEALTNLRDPSALLVSAIADCCLVKLRLLEHREAGTGDAIKAVLDDILARLASTNAEHAKLLSSRYWDGATQSETAVEMHLSVRTIRYRQNSAIEAFAAILRDLEAQCGRSALPHSAANQHGIVARQDTKPNSLSLKPSAQAGSPGRIEPGYSVRHRSRVRSRGDRRVTFIFGAAFAVALLLLFAYTSAQSTGKQDKIQWLTRTPEHHPYRVFDFEGANDAEGEWRSFKRSVSPNGHRFAGEYGNEAVSLRLEELPTHAAVVIAFDVLMIRSWDGEGQDYLFQGTEFEIGPDSWGFHLDRARRPSFVATFSNNDGNYGPDIPQSFPGLGSDSSFPASAGASSIDSLGYTFNADPMDAVYSFVFRIEHSAPAFQITFFADLVEAASIDLLANESWGIDNVSVWLEK